MSFVRTVLGDIAPGNLGVCDAHEHLFIGQSFATDRFPEYRLDDVEAQTADLKAFKDAGGQAIVDSMPGGGAGRSVLALAELSRRTGVHILCPTGLHLAKYYPPGHWGSTLTAEQLAEVFVAEIEQGIDENDLAGPDVRRTPHRAGLIKVATGPTPFTDHDRKMLLAASIAHARTGAPILTHTEQGEGAMEQVQAFRARGVDLSRVVLSHTDRKPEVSYHRQILQTGVCVEYDSGFRWKPGQGNPTLDLVLALADAFPHQILLGMDIARRSYWPAYGGSPGLAWLLTDFAGRLRPAGLSPAALKRILIHNPAGAFSFGAGKEQQR